MSLPSYPGQPGHTDPSSGLGRSAPLGQGDAAGYGPPAPRPTDASPSTPWIWAIALLPLVSLLTLPMMDFETYFADTVRAAEQGSTAVGMSGGMIAAQVISYALYGVTVVLAFLDRRELLRRGFDRPFPWPWAFLGIVYVIGRSVVVKRRSGRGLAPMVVYLVLTVVSVAVSIVVVVAAFAAVAPMLEQLSTTP